MATESQPFDVQALALSYSKEPGKRVEFADRMKIVEHFGDLVAGVGLLQQFPGASSLVPRLLADYDVRNGCLAMANPDMQGEEYKALSRNIHETIAKALISEDVKRDESPSLVPSVEDGRRVDVLAKKLAEQPPQRYDFSNNKTDVVPYKSLDAMTMDQWSIAVRNVLSRYALNAERVENMSDADYDNSLRSINQQDGNRNSLFKDMLYATGSLAFPDPSTDRDMNAFKSFLERNKN